MSNAVSGKLPPSSSCGVFAYHRVSFALTAPTTPTLVYKRGAERQRSGQPELITEVYLLAAWIFHGDNSTPIDTPNRLKAR